MLPLQALESAQPIANMLDARDLIVRPVVGTALHRLCELSCTDESYVSGDQGNHEVLLSAVSNVTNMPDVTAGVSLHTVDLNTLAEEVGAAVTRHLAFARTVVAPAVDELVQRVASSIEQVMRSDLNQLEVVVYRMPAPMYEPSFVDSFMRAEDVIADNFVAGMNFPVEAECVQIIDWLKSGVTSLDAAIDQYVANIGLDCLCKIYKDLFTPSSKPTQVWDLLNAPDCGLDYAVIGFLMTRKLWDNPPEGIDVPLETYEREMVQLRNQCALRLIYEMRRTERDEAAGILVRRYNRSSVEVNDAVYRKWLEAGGDHTVLFGNILSDRPHITVAEIGEHQQEAKAAWDRYCLINQTAAANKRFSAAKLIVRTEFDAMLNNASHDDLPLNERPVMLAKFTQALAQTRENEVENLYDWALRLLCESCYYKSDAYRILSSINRIKAQSPDVDVKEAAAVAALDYISYWVSSQFCVDVATR